MIWINKQQEPASWTQRRLTPNATYEATPDLRDSLLKEQGYICAYCMRRLPVSDAPYENATSKIEHLLSQKKHDELQLEYSNMVVCCPGRLFGNLHCDASKGEEDIQCSPLSQEAMSTIQYYNDGTIKSTNAAYNTEINDVLQLNIDILKSNRKALWEAVRKEIQRHDDRTLAFMRRVLDVYKSFDADGKRIPYCGIVIYKLTKRLRQSGVMV